MGLRWLVCSLTILATKRPNISCFCSTCFKPKKYTQNNPNKSTTMAYPAVVLTQLLLQILSGTPTHTQTTNCWNSIDSKKATNETKDSPAWPQDWRPQRQSQVEPGVGWKTSDTWGNVWDDEVFKNPVSWTSYLMEIHRPRVVQNQIFFKYCPMKGKSVNVFMRMVSNSPEISFVKRNMRASPNYFATFNFQCKRQELDLKKACGHSHNPFSKS